MRLFAGLCAVVLVTVLCGSSGAAGWVASDTVHNPVNLTHTDALVRLKVTVPQAVGHANVGVRVAGQPVPHQFDEHGQLWVAVTLAPMQGVTFEVSDQPTQAWPGVKLDGPVSDAVAALVGDEAKVEAGPLFVRYHTVTPGGHHRQVTAQPGKPFAVVEEWVAAGGEADSSFELSRGMTGQLTGLMRRWYQGPFQAADGLETVKLENSATRVPGALIHLQPRWTQGYDDGWFFGVTDGQRMAGVLPLRAGLWRWPHEVKPTVRAEDGRVFVDLSAKRGRNHWLLLVGPRALADQVHDIARREGFAPLDKLHHTYVLGPANEGEKPANVADFYSNQTNPTDMIRRFARAALKDAQDGKTRTGLAAAYECQARFDADWYGRYEHGWSPINPNFHTDFMKLPILQAAMLRNDPSFAHVRQLAEDAFRRDMEYAVTLPGGAGQECPGYQAHAAQQWLALLPVVKQHLGFDPSSWPRWKATGRFILHSSQPDGAGKRAFHPGGDTHPGQPDPAAFARQLGYEADPRQMVTEELPGFGVVFRDKPGTAEETYLAFKAGPNRGHYHGDQLSFHLSFNARPAAVDHHASYKPRPGQEHMHNRLSFAADGMDHANMDGHERLIAFKATAAVDVAVAQVESPRLRKVKELPPEDWDDATVTQWFDKPLTYRRTIVFIKGAKDADGKPIKPFFIIRDQYEGPSLDVTLNMHGLGADAKVEGPAIRFDRLSAYVVKPAAFKPQMFNWEHDNGGREQTVNPRITESGETVEFITLLCPGDSRPKVDTTPAGVRVGDTLVEFGPGLPDKDKRTGQASFGVTVQRGSQDLLRLGADDIDLHRSQGEIGLFVPDVGYPFGPIPDWLIEQRGMGDAAE